jgi:hypothetical protein
VASQLGQDQEVLGSTENDAASAPRSADARILLSDR